VDRAIEHAAAELNESSVRWEPEPQDFRRLRRKLFNCIRAAREGEFQIGFEQVVKRRVRGPYLLILYAWMQEEPTAFFGISA